MSQKEEYKLLVLPTANSQHRRDLVPGDRSAPTIVQAPSGPADPRCRALPCLLSGCHLSRQV